MGPSEFEKYLSACEMLLGGRETSLTGTGEDGSARKSSTNTSESGNSGSASSSRD